MQSYIPTIGLEVHIQLNTKTKIFCGCETSFGDKPNTHICPTCLGLPGALPVLNKSVVEKAMLAGLAIKATIHQRSKFDRKNYFYPDLPKAYQISQLYEPYCTDGEISIIKENGTQKKIGVTRIHMEEDAGKLVHSEDPSVSESYIDLNRAGTPLIEVVSEPEIDDSEEAYLYLTELKNIMQFIGISDCSMEQGSLRCDANVSVRLEGTTELGTRTETKNLNSFKAVKAAIEYEIERQIDVLSSGGRIVQESRLWNADLNQTFSMRSKEEAHDYRYFPDPDLVPIILSDEELEDIKKQMPELPSQKKERYKNKLKLPEHDTNILTSERSYSDFFEATIEAGAPIKKAANWILGEMLAIVSETNKTLFELCTPKQLAELINEIESGKISGKIAKEVLILVIETSKDPKVIIEEKGLAQISDTSAVDGFIDEVISENPKSVEEYKSGKTKVIGFLVGQIMKKSKGKANPQLVNQLLRDKLK